MPYTHVEKHENVLTRPLAIWFINRFKPTLYTGYISDLKSIIFHEEFLRVKDVK